jgi:hypothetical protein
VDVEPIHVAAFVKDLQGRFSPPTVKQHLAALRMLFEGVVIAAASDPDAAAFQTLAQRGEDSGFIQPPVRLAVREDQLAPLRRQER